MLENELKPKDKLVADKIRTLFDAPMILQGF